MSCARNVAATSPNWPMDPDGCLRSGYALPPPQLIARYVGRTWALPAADSGDRERRDRKLVNGKFGPS